MALLFGEGGTEEAGSEFEERVRLLRERSDRLLETLAGEDREDLVDRVSRMLDAADGPKEELEKAILDLEDLLFYFEV